MVWKEETGWQRVTLELMAEPISSFENLLGKGY